MKPKRAEKKIFKEIIFGKWNTININTMMSSVYTGLFKVCRMDSTHTAGEYITGLLH